MNAMTPSSQDPTDSLDRCVLATTYLLVRGFDQRAVGLDHHGPRAVAIAEGEARAPSIVVDTLLGHTVDAAASASPLSAPRPTAPAGRKQIRSNGDLAVSDGDDGRWEGAHGGLSSAKVRFIAELRPGEKLMQSSWISASASGSPTKPHR